MQGGEAKNHSSACEIYEQIVNYIFIREHAIDKKSSPKQVRLFAIARDEVDSFSRKTEGVSSFYERIMTDCLRSKCI